MTPVALDPDVLAKLTANGGAVPLSDKDGKPVGYFLSPELYAQMRKAMYDKAFAEITDEEVRAALADPRRHSMEEVFKLLEAE